MKLLSFTLNDNAIVARSFSVDLSKFKIQFEISDIVQKEEWGKMTEPKSTMYEYYSDSEINRIDVIDIYNCSLVANKIRSHSKI